MEITLDDKLKYMQAARRGDLATIKELVGKGVPIDIFNNGALFESCYYGHLPVVAFLVESKIEVNKYDGLALYLAFKHSPFNVAEYLIRKDAINNFTSDTMPHKTIHPTNISEYLIEEGHYIAYALGRNNRSIIDWCESQMLEKERVLKNDVKLQEDVIIEQPVEKSEKKARKMKK